MSGPGSRLMQYLGGTSATKKARLGVNPSAGESTASLAGSHIPGSTSGTAAPHPEPTQQPRSFAQAAGSSPSKRSGPAPPAYPRPQLVRGKPLLKHDDYESMERPAPSTSVPNLLYIDMRSSSLTPEQVLEAAFPVLGTDVLGFQLFAAQKTLGLVFASADSCAKAANQPLGDTGLTMYRAPTAPVNLLKLTLQGVPFWDIPGVLADLPTILRPCGDLVFLAPMVTAKGYYSVQWHATISRPASSVDFPPKTITLRGEQVIVDVAGQCRYCRHCESLAHVKPSCRQWARLRSRLNQQARDQAAVDAARKQQQPCTQPQHQQTQPQQTAQQQQPQLQHPQQQQQQPLQHQHQQPQLRVPARLPEHWEDEAEDMEDAAPMGEYSAEDQFRCATEIVTRAAENSISVDPEILAAAREYIASVTGTVGGGQ